MVNAAFSTNHKSRPIGFLPTAAVLGCSILYGCHTPTEAVRESRLSAAGRAALESGTTVIGASVQGRPIECITLGDGPDCAMIIATIHGDEDAGTPLVLHLADTLVSRPELIDGRRIVLVPVANPDGMAHQTRENVRNVDLNRNYPASNYTKKPDHGAAPLSEPESVAIHQLIGRHRPSRIVSIHQVLRSGSPCIDYDGPARPLADAMARYCELPVERIGSYPGSLGSYAGETLGVPIITFELPPGAKGLRGAVLWEQYGAALLAAVVYPEPPADATLRLAK
ncbi:MAG: DUF2817 domain-containing protein [Phycisphaerae bacterium]